MILALKNSTSVAVKIRPEKNSDPYGIWTHDLCDTSAALYGIAEFMSYQIPYGSEFFTGLYIHYHLSSVHNCEDRFHIPFLKFSSHNYMFFIYLQSCMRMFKTNKIFMIHAVKTLFLLRRWRYGNWPWWPYMSQNITTIYNSASSEIIFVGSHACYLIGPSKNHCSNFRPILTN